MVGLEAILERILETLLSKANARVDVTVSIRLGRHDERTVGVDFALTTCPNCKGTGELKVTDGVGVTCPKCHGEGRL
jgi:DnaJ-class molecular chaperone